MEKPVLV